MGSKQSTISWILLCFLALVWGSSFILIKKSLLAFSPLQIAGLRISISAIAFLPLLLPRLKDVKLHEWKYLLIVGLCGFGVPAFLFALAQTQIESTVAGILNTLTPLFTLIIGVLVFSLRLALRKVIGVLLGFVGAAVLIRYGEGSFSINNLFYPLLIVIATILYAVSVNTVKSKLQYMKATTISSVSFALIGPPALIYLLFSGIEVPYQTSPDFWLSFGSVVILAMAGTVIASILFWRLVQMTNAIFSSSVAYMIPIVATLFGVIDGESITVFHILALVLILIGVALSRGSDEMEEDKP